MTSSSLKYVHTCTMAVVTDKNQQMIDFLENSDGVVANGFKVLMLLATEPMVSDVSNSEIDLYHGANVECRWCGDTTWPPNQIGSKNKAKYWIPFGNEFRKLRIEFLPLHFSPAMDLQKQKQKKKGDKMQANRWQSWCSGSTLCVCGVAKHVVALIAMCNHSHFLCYSFLPFLCLLLFDCKLRLHSPNTEVNVTAIHRRTKTTNKCNKKTEKQLRSHTT